MNKIYYLVVLIILFGSNAMAENYKEAIFAGGCFWCMEKPFDQIDGVISTTSGYSGGDIENPSYEQVSSGTTGHIEVVRIEYDPAKVSYKQLLDAYWPNVDAVDGDGQFCDRGSQYISAIFYKNEEEKKLALVSKKEKEQILEMPIATQIIPFKKFWPAEGYHQDYYKKNPIRYNFYRSGCGRDKRLQELWDNK